MKTLELTESQEAELRRMKVHFPYRIAYAALHPETGEFWVSAVFTMRIPNKFARQGYEIFTLQTK